jgi:serine/threonine protein kinase
MGSECLELKENFDIEHQTTDFTLPLTALPKQFITGEIKTKEGRARCNIQYGALENRGNYGSVSRVKRNPVPSGNPSLCVKQPHDSEFSLCPEALIQWYSVKTLEAAGIFGAVPHIYDIFQYASETRFCMEYIEGVSAVEYICMNAQPEQTWYQVMAQAALILGFLEETIRLDHRDLKADNLWIRERPVDYCLRVGGVQWKLQAPFQVVILDFGFACLGGRDGNARISLSDGILPTIDPCPKEGRDLFHLVSSLWSVPPVRERMSTEFKGEIEELLSYGGTQFASIIHRTLRPRWIYLATSDPAFHYPPLVPGAILRKLSSVWKGSGSLRIEECQQENRRIHGSLS